MKLDKVSEFMEQAGIPGRDLYDRPASGKEFPDGCHYRIEFSGVEGPKALEALSFTYLYRRRTVVRKNLLEVRVRLERLFFTVIFQWP